MYRSGCLICGLLFSLFGSTAWADSYEIGESFPAGKRYIVTSRVELEGTMTVPAMNGQQPETLRVTGHSAVEYAERVLNMEDQQTFRVYRKMNFIRKVGDRSEESSLRPEVKRLVLIRHGTEEVPFSPDGPLTWSEIDRVRTDMFTPALGGLFPAQSVRVGDNWEAHEAAVKELTDMDKIDEGRLSCRLEDVNTQGGRHVARIGFSGTVKGLNQDGPTRQQLDGYFYFDLRSKYLTYLYINGAGWMLSPEGKTLGRIQGRYILTRRPAENTPELADSVIRSVQLESNERNTQLLFREPSLGVEFVYPRRWTVQRADARQIALSEPGEGGILITLEPLSKMKSADQFRREAVEQFQKNSARITGESAVRKLPARNGRLQQFSLNIRQRGIELSFEYLLGRQRSAGFIVAGRFPAGQARILKEDAHVIARGLILSPPGGTP